MDTKLTSKKNADRLIHWLRDYAALRIDSYVLDAQDSLPPHVYADLGAEGFFSMHVSKKHGGLELDTLDMLRVVEQIAAIDLSLVTLIIESIQGAHTLEKYANESMKKKYLPLLARGRIFVSGAMTESAAGSNPRAMKAIAIPHHEDGWLLKGSKRWVGMAEWATLIAVYVQQLDSNHNWVGMSGFLVPQHTPGLKIGPHAPTMGIRGFPKNTIYMDNVPVTQEHLLGQAGEGMEIAQDNMMYIRLCLAAASLGGMKRAVQLMHRYAERRTIATGRLIENPVSLHKLSEITAIIEALDAFVYGIAQWMDEGTHVPEEMFVVAKVLCSEYLGKSVDTLVQMLGARGYEEASGVSKIYRDARVFRIFEGPTEALTMYLGSRILEKNPLLETFVREVMNESALLDNLFSTVKQVYQQCLDNQNPIFNKPFTQTYWAQSLAGEICAMGLVLTLIETILGKANRGVIWARDQFNKLIEHALSSSRNQHLLIKSTQLLETISNYTDTIGNIEQIRNTQHFLIDPLLKKNQESEIQEFHALSDPNLDQSTEVHELEEEFPVISETEQQQLLHEWNNIEKAVPIPHKPVHAFFEEQAKQTPHATAVVFYDQSVTYHELNQRANRVAHFLQSKGVKSNALIAIYMERSIEMIAVLLGILKAGAAYLPLDQHYPAPMLKFMMEDAKAQFLLTQSKCVANLPSDSIQTFCYEDIPEGHEANPNVDINTHHPAYVIYTSGSSGQPKGVKLPHRALVNLLTWHGKQINTKRNILQFTSLNFDMSFLEIFSALSNGGKLILITENDRIDVHALRRIVKTHEVEQLMIPVSFLKQLATTHLKKKELYTLKEIIVAGEQIIPTKEMIQFFCHLHDCKLLNYYGPAETHVVTAYEFPHQTEDWPSYPPIGRPIDNTKILILNENMEMVPIGEVGEIYIGGLSLATGYVNRPELTQERFLDDPWSEHPGEKLYKTGDYGRFLPDGNILYVGRRDHQIKIRGFRVELQEIELSLLKFPEIQESVVIVKNDDLLGKYLEAFVVLNSAKKPDFFEKLHAYVKETLPAHMTPSSFHVIESMPLTSSGKINRRILENYGEDYIKHSQHFGHLLHPKTDTEKKLVKIIEDLFKIPVGVNHSFISIGGNSLLSMHVASHIYNEFDIEIPAFHVLSDPNLASTAERIDRLRKEA